MLQDRASVLTGLGIGVGLMYFLDPERGRRRRAGLRDRLAHATHVAGEAAGATGRDVAHRASGLAARMRGTLRRQPVNDRVLVERVRAQLGRLVSHPRALHVEAVDGIVSVRGPILQHEVERLLKGVERVRGVREIVDELEPHQDAGNVASLQGGSTERERVPGIGPRQWSPTTRLITGTTGAALAGYGATHRTMPGALLAAAGVGLLARAATNLDARRLTGIGSGRG